MKYVVLLVAASLMASARADELSCGFVERATLGVAARLDEGNAERPDRAAELLGVHEVEEGKDLVLLFRGFHSVQGVVDADAYWKLTVSVHDPIDGETIDLAMGSSTKVRFSTGGSSWVKKGYGYAAVQGTGSLRLQRANADILIGDIDMTFDAQRAEEPSEKIRYRVSGAIYAYKIVLKDLTRWQSARINTQDGSDEYTIAAAARPSVGERTQNLWHSRCDVDVSKQG